MGESWKEGERNFWDGRQSVTATKASSSKKKMAQPNPSNIEEMKELRGEGGSDVFTSTRHINNTPEQTSNAFKMKFWSTDDAPLIRPILNKSVYMAPPVAMSPMESPKLYADGYGGAGCEKVTKLSRRTLFAKAANVVALCVAGLSVFGALVYLKKPVKQDTSTKGKLV